MQKIFVGDVQGCADELDDVLVRAHADFGSEFELWLVGDMINRGPDNVRVLRQVRELRDAGRLRVVLGNHETGLFMKSLGVRKLRKSDTIGDVLALPDASDWKGWLRSLPLVETSMLGNQPFAMVHASVSPEWSLDELSVLAERAQQSLREGPFEALANFFAPENRDDPWRDVVDRLTRCRSIDSEGFWSDELPATPADAWHARFAAGEHDYGVVYGHWALQGLHVADGFRGLDTGCVHHGRDRDGFLTAWLPDSASARPFDTLDTPLERFWQIPAKRSYYSS